MFTAVASASNWVSSLLSKTPAGLEFEEDDFREVKRAKKLPLFDKIPDSPVPQVLVSKLAVGGMHSVAITPTGLAYSWGCNDEGALGRKGKEDKPLLVPLPIRVDGAACGDSHTVLWNTSQSRSFLTGLYRVSSFSLC